jgi:hypothetical protein
VRYSRIPRYSGPVPASGGGVDRRGGRSDGLDERQRAERNDRGQDERLGYARGFPTVLGDAERRGRPHLDVRREMTTPPCRDALGRHVDAVAGPHGVHIGVRLGEVAVAEPDPPSDAPRIEGEPDDDEDRLALRRLVGRYDLGAEITEAEEREDRSRKDGADQDRGDHEQPSGLGVRAHQEDDRRSEQQTCGALAQAHRAHPAVACSGTGTSSSTRATT